MQQFDLKKGLPRILLGVYAFLLFMICTSLGVPPHDLPLCGLLFVIAVFGFISTRREGRRWQIIWGIGLGMAVAFAASEITAGRLIADKQAEISWSNQDGWDQYAHLLTTNRPNRNDIIGGYRLTQQTITSNGLVPVDGRICELELRADGSFQVTNYPIWSVDKVADFISTNGQWTLDSIGIVNGNQKTWGIRFADADRRIDDPQFIGTSGPYSLLFTYGDPDENKVMIFEWRK